MVEIVEAKSDELEELVDCVRKLFLEDAGSYDEFADTSWPNREGLAYYGPLVKDSNALLLLARIDEEPVGHLVGLLSPPTPTRRDVTFGVLQSIFVNEGARGQGIGSELCDAFLVWAKEAGCAQATVNAYAKNTRAESLYTKHGFISQSRTSVVRL